MGKRRLQRKAVEHRLMACGKASWREVGQGHKYAPLSEPGQMNHSHLTMCADVTATGVRNRWRLPRRGILEFDFVTNSPSHVYTQHIRLDLSKQEHRKVRDCIVQSCI